VNFRLLRRLLLVIRLQRVCKEVYLGTEERSGGQFLLERWVYVPHACCPPIQSILIIPPKRCQACHAPPRPSGQSAEHGRNTGTGR
jgi:hypothetical protein